MSCQLSVIAVVLMMYFAGAIEETGNPCLNRINWCSRWAVDGWCQRNPRYMLARFESWVKSVALIPSAVPKDELPAVGDRGCSDDVLRRCHRRDG
mmetsp:Transcript_129439/g.307113  ORF Transcript_129439/g.307113 Transcript_129439/m.307113 type:complete len:95 (-) Transcript_129439:81-365(-)